MKSKQTLKIYLQSVDASDTLTQKVRQRLRSLDRIYNSRRSPLPRLNLKQRRKSQFDMSIHRRVSSEIDRILTNKEEENKFKTLRRQSCHPFGRSPNNHNFMKTVAEKTNKTDLSLLNRSFRTKKSPQLQKPALITQSHHKELCISPIQLRQVKQISGYILILLIRLDVQGLKIMAVPRDDPSSQPRVIRMSPEHTKVYLDKNCQGRVEKIFQCLTYDGEELAI